MKKTSFSPTLSFKTPLVVYELFNGDWMVHPVADSTLVSFGRGHAALEEQQIFLEEYLARADAETLASFTIPRAELREVLVVAKREDLPKRLQTNPTFSVPCVLIPSRRDFWVIILPLDHTFYVRHDEDLEEEIRSEVARIVAAREDLAAEYLRMFPARVHRLEELSVTLDRSDKIIPERARARRTEIKSRLKKRDAFEVLQSVGTALHHRQDTLSGPGVLCRDKELKLLSSLLEGKQRLSGVIVGEELVGKSALMRAWMRSPSARRSDGGTRLVYATSAAQLIAGMSALGQWQERVRRVMEAAEVLDAVIYFEQFADMFSDRSRGGMDLAAAIKPFIDDNRVRVIGELRPEEADSIQRRHIGLMSALTRIRVEPLTVQDSEKILREDVSWHAAHLPDVPNLEGEAIEPLLDLVDRYLPYRAFPGKALRFVAELRSIYDKERTATGDPVSLSRTNVFSAFSLQSGVPVFLLRDDHALKAEEIERAIRRSLIGQDAAVEQVVQTVCRVKAGLQPANRPLASFLFVGPTGVGKTELSRALAEYLFGSVDRLVRFDMSEFAGLDAAERLISGSDWADGLLTRKLREQPFCVVLLDEIEKAHPAVFDLLLQVLGEARLTDVRGKTAFFHNAIIIMTSNIGAAHRRTATGFGAKPEPVEQHYTAEVERWFRPEFIGRLDRVVHFSPLTAQEIAKIVIIAVRRIQKRRGLDELGISLDIVSEVLQKIGRDGYSEAYGARALKRQIEDRLMTPIAQLLSEVGRPSQGGVLNVQLAAGAKGAEEGTVQKGRKKVVATLVKDGIMFSLERATARKDKRQLNSVMDLTHLRRRLEQYLRLDEVEEVKADLEFTITQLNEASRAPRKDSRVSVEIAKLQQDHDRLTRVWDRAISLRGQIREIEELTLTAMFEGEDELSPFIEEAVDIGNQFMRNLFWLLVVRRKRTYAATLLLQELDDKRGLQYWLLPFLRSLGDRKWNAQLHIQGDRGAPDVKWFEDIAWGPPIVATRAIDIISNPARKQTSFILTAEGPGIGAVLALESGLIRYALDSGEVANLHVSLIDMGASFTQKQWCSSVFTPVSPASYSLLRIKPHTRLIDEKEGKVHICDKKRTLDLPMAEYWKRIEEVSLQHLLLYEQSDDLNTDELFIGALAKQWVEEEDDDEEE